ncbi:MAG TPA: hypothetical protein VIH86_06095 [Puia sp.]|jgi:hypothetical protein
MPIQPTQKHLPKLLIAMTILFAACIFSCNGSGSSTETKDSTVVKDSTTIKDTTKMKTDSTSKTDTSGKGGQQTPTGK